jgi:hypothetical protein
MSVAQLGPVKPAGQQLGPPNPGKQLQVPSARLTPCPLQVTASLNSQALPVWPGRQEHKPLPEKPWLQVPKLLHGVVAPPGHGRQLGP